jgi:hypothetical protein
MGVYLTHGLRGSNPRPKGPKGRPVAKLLGRLAMFYVGLARAFKDTCLHEEWKAKVMEKVRVGCSTRPASHHLAPNRLVQVCGAPPQPYKYPLRWK